MSEPTSSDDLRGLVAIIRRRAAVIVACAVVVPLAALGLSLLQPREYTASSLLLFRNPAFDQQLFGATVLPQSRDADREAATNVRLASVHAVAQITASDAAIRSARLGIRPADIWPKVQVRPQGQADIAAVTVTDSSPTFAALLANTFAQDFIDYRRDTDRATIRVAQRMVQKQLKAIGARTSADRARRASLERRAEELGILASLQTGGAELVQRADPPSAPSSPRIKRNVAVGVVFGVILGFALAFLIERLDRRFRDPKEVEAAFGRPVLATVPQLRESSARKASVPGIDLEPFRMLRANLRYFNLDHRITSLLVTSAAPGDGKTTVAMNLALAAAEAGDRVLLVEADLRRPTLAGRLAQQPERPGLSMLIASDLDLVDAVQPVALNAVLPHATTDAVLDVLFAGPQPPNPMDLLESERMRDLLRDAEAMYELVVVDTPPTSVVSDAIPVMQNVDGVLIVSRLGRSTRDAAQHLRDQLQLLHARTLGVVANFVRDSASYYGAYGYGYPPGNAEEQQPGELTKT